jgi:hypothetical protein
LGRISQGEWFVEKSSEFIEDRQVDALLRGAAAGYATVLHELALPMGALPEELP